MQMVPEMPRAFGQGGVVVEREVTVRERRDVVGPPKPRAG